jgi:hypothetical protein
VTAETVYLEAYYPHTSLGFLIPSLLLFAALTAIAAYLLWPVAIPFALVMLYLLRFTWRQAHGPDLAIRVTGRAVYYRGWERGLWRGGLQGGLLPLDAIGHVELLNLRSAAAAGPVVALWLTDPGRWLKQSRLWRWTREISAGGDLAIACDETDRTADQVREALEAAMVHPDPPSPRP